MEELASAAGYVVNPLTFVPGTIGPDLDTVSLAPAILDLAFIYSTVREDNFVFELEPWLV